MSDAADGIGLCCAIADCFVLKSRDIKLLKYIFLWRMIDK
jgi:hypothetical protein